LYFSILDVKLFIVVVNEKELICLRTTKMKADVAFFLILYQWRLIL